MFSDEQYEAAKRLDINIVVLPKGGAWHVGEGSEAWCGSSGMQARLLSANAMRERSPCNRCAPRLRAHGTTMNAVRAALYDRALGWPASKGLNRVARHIQAERREGVHRAEGAPVLNRYEVVYSASNPSLAARAMLSILAAITADECTAEDVGLDETWVREQNERLGLFQEGRSRWLLDLSRLPEMAPEERECVFHALYELATRHYSGSLLFPPDGPPDAVVINVSGENPAALGAVCSGLPYHLMEEVAPDLWSRWVPDDDNLPDSLMEGGASDLENQSIPMRWRHSPNASYDPETHHRGLVQERATLGHAYEHEAALCGTPLRVLQGSEASGWVPAIDVTCRGCVRELQARGVDASDQRALLRWYHANEQTAQIHADLSDYAWNVFYESAGWRDLELGNVSRPVNVFLSETADVLAAAGRAEEAEIFRGLGAAMQPNGSIEISLRRFLVRVARQALSGVDPSNFLMTDRGVEILGPDHLLSELRDAALPPRRAELAGIRQAAAARGGP